MRAPRLPPGLLLRQVEHRLAPHLPYWRRPSPRLPQLESPQGWPLPQRGARQAFPQVPPPLDSPLPGPPRAPGLPPPLLGPWWGYSFSRSSVRACFAPQHSGKQAARTGEDRERKVAPWPYSMGKPARDGCPAFGPISEGLHDTPPAGARPSHTSFVLVVARSPDRATRPTEGFLFRPLGNATLPSGILPPTPPLRRVAFPGRNLLVSRPPQKRNRQDTPQPQKSHTRPDTPAPAPPSPQPTPPAPSVWTP